MPYQDGTLNGEDYAALARTELERADESSCGPELQALTHVAQGIGYALLALREDLDWARRQAT